MGGPGSGRKPDRAKEGFSLPPDDGTVASIQARLNAISEGVASGEVPPRIGDTLIASEKAKMIGIKNEQNREELNELRALLTEAKEIHRKRVAKEVSDRTHAVDSDLH